MRLVQPMDVVGLLVVGEENAPVDGELEADVEVALAAVNDLKIGGY
jgi:hypothetical protein